MKKRAIAVGVVVLGTALASIGTTPALSQQLRTRAAAAAHGFTARQIHSFPYKGNFPSTATSRTPASTVPGACTMALPALLATIEVRIAGAADFCEIASQGLGGDVFHSSMLVTPNLLWHYRAGSISCQLRFQLTNYTIAIRNSASSCRWFTSAATGWHREDARALS